MTTRRPAIVGNWKMNLGGRQGVEQARHLIGEVTSAGPDDPQLVVLAPFTALHVLHELTGATPSALEYGAQDISSHDEGAFTGEVSGSMLTEFGVRYALAGHSERRARHGEQGESINAKVHAALRHGITPIVCVGEELAVRRAGNHVSHTLIQVDEALAGVTASDVASLLIAYEPVWAIGTGEVATPEDAQEVCAAIRSRIAELYDAGTAAQVRILYGGSVKPSTSAAIVGQPDVDGALVGGASLDPEQLVAIWRAARTNPTLNPVS
jgi:triosephosphate isomerase